MAIQGKAASVVFENVTKRFGGVTAVNDVSFTIDPGKLVTFLGPSGCGKTTILRLTGGLEIATSGRILIGDRNVTLLPPTERDVSMVFQSYALFPHMSVLENVAYGLVSGGMPKAKAHALAEDGLGLVRLSGLGTRMPNELSGGQQQRVAVARALVLEPQVLLFDEPLSNLDAKLRRSVRDEIREIQTSLGLTVIYVTHDQEEALAVSDRIVVMREAGIAQEGSPRDIYEEPVDLYIADFIGDANLVDVTVTALEGPQALVQVGDLTLRLPHRGIPAGPAHVAVRPESILLRDEEPGAPGRGVVRKATYLGKHMHYTVECAFGELFVVSPETRTVWAPGAPVSLSLANHGVTLIHEGSART